MVLRLRAVSHTRQPPRSDGRTGHGDLVDRLVEQMPAPPRPDLVLMAYAVADLTSPKTVVSHLNMVTGGSAHSLALSGQGLGAPFSALRVADAYERAGRCSEFLLAVVEQAAPAKSGGPTVDSGVLLAFDRSAGFGALATVGCLEKPGELADRLAGLRSPGGRLLVVLGPGADDDVLPGADMDVHQVPPGSYCTSVWLAVAKHLAEWQGGYDTVALYDTDQRSPSYRSYLAVLKGANR